MGRFFGSKSPKDASIPETPGAHYVRQPDHESQGNYAGLTMTHLPVAKPVEAEVVTVPMDQQQSPLKYEQQQKPTNVFQQVWRKERRLLVAIVLVTILMLAEFGHYLLYPFWLFAIWTHEICHGFAAIIVGGTIKKIYIYSNTGGVCYYNGVGDGKWAKAFVSSAGFCGSAIVGGLMLLFRRLKKGVKIGMILIGSTVVLSSILWIRNSFGFWVMMAIGVTILLAGIFVKKGLGTMYAFLAATSCLSTIIDCHYLKDTGDVVNGDITMDSDAIQVAEQLGGSGYCWAIVWLCQAVIMFILGLVLAFDADEREYYDYT